MKNALSVTDHPSCKAGELIIFREKESGRYFLRCEERILEWADIEKIGDKNAGVLLSFGPSVPASPEEMKNHSWAKHIMRNTWSDGSS